MNIIIVGYGKLSFYKQTGFVGDRFKWLIGLKPVLFLDEIKERQGKDNKNVIT